MYLSRAVPRQDIWRSPELLSMFESSYSIHQAVWSMFPPDADRKRDFLYRYDLKNGQPVIYLLSPEAPESLHGMWHVESKVYEPKISAGDVLGFTVRVNPVITRWVEDVKRGKQVQKRHDVVMDFKHRCQEEGILCSQQEAEYSAGLKWFADRGEKYGFSLIEPSFRVNEYVRREFVKKGKKQKVVISTLDAEGMLTVTNPERFVEMLYSGIGPAKGFGCGLMLVRRVSL